MKALFDASALLNIIKMLGEKSLEYIRGGYELTLTPYEIGNALWKEVTLLKRLNIDEALTLLKLLSIIHERYLVAVDPLNQVLVLKLAHALKLTFYDASYVVAASEHKTLLVTDDSKLREKIKSHKNIIEKTLGTGVEALSSSEYVALRNKYEKRNR